MNAQDFRCWSLSPKGATTCFKLSSTSLLTYIILLLLYSSTSMAQDQFLWTGASSTHWTDSSNWDYYPYGGAVAISPAPFYPGQVGLSNPNGPKNDIAIFTNKSNVDCHINKICTATDSALRVGGILVEGYQGTITQLDGNRFNVAESDDAGGDGFWDGSTLINSAHPDLFPVNTWQAYQAYFNFAAPSNGFQGGATIVGGISPSYALLIAVPFKLVNRNFKAPEDETRFRHDAAIVNGPDFDNSHQGTVVLSNRTGGTGTRYYQFGGVHFWDLKVTPNGALPRTKEFSGGLIRVEHNFMTTGLLGVLYGPSYPVVMNAALGTEIHIRQDLIVGNVFPAPSYTAASAFGNLALVMKGSLDQVIHHANPDNFTGNLPTVRIEKGAGVVSLFGPVTVNNHLEFVSGIVKPMTSSTQNLLTTDVFVVNSNTTVSGASDLSFCQGAIRVRTGKTIELPIGKGSVYRPAIVRPISGVSIDYSSDNMYVAEYFEAPITPTAPVSSFEIPILTEIKDCEVWAIQKYNNTASDPWVFDLELSFDPSNCNPSFMYDDPCKIAITRWDESSSKWVSHGNGGYFETTHPLIALRDQTLKTDLSLVAPNFERSNPRPDLFTFGKLAEPVCDSCAVEVCVDYCVTGNSFTFTPNITHSIGSSFAGIDWDFGDGGSSSDLSPTHDFIGAGIQNISVTVYGAIGADTCSTTYNFQVINNNCSPPMELRRFKPDAKQEKKIKTIDKAASQQLLISPNPSSVGTIQFSLESIEKGSFDYQITTYSGKTIQTGQIKAKQTLTVNSSKWTTGAYIMSIQLPNKKISQPFMINN